MGVIVTLATKALKPHPSYVPLAATSSEEMLSAEVLRPYLGFLQSSDSDIVLDEDNSLRAGRRASSAAVLLEKVPSVLEALLVTADEDTEEEDNW